MYLDRRSSFLLSAAAAVSVMQCDQIAKNPDFLGSAVVECRTWLVATTAGGSIMAMNRDEGQKAARNELLAVIDTVPLTLQRQEVIAGMSELAASISAQEAQNKSLATDVAGVEREFGRADQLARQGSAPEQLRDNLGSQLQSTQLKLAASRHMVSSLQAKDQALIIKRRLLDDQIRRCYVQAPADGIILTRYRNAGEVAAPGNPLFELGAFDTLYADFFVPQTVLAAISCGQKVRIRVDFDDGTAKEKMKFLPAVVTWIGSEAEFSPKNIQTRQSRNELVFRVRATVPNGEGVLKRGLPVEVWR
ncbi:MAG: HlyD family efflux transporter periplasmic adaptor subunit [Chitinispirillaceae bacterium]|nr:HlyD family efflux transporter periplasmic adaptor subunit [Chitinispirillaceae bacterium]